MRAVSPPRSIIAWKSRSRWARQNRRRSFGTAAQAEWRSAVSTPANSPPSRSCSVARDRSGRTANSVADGPTAVHSLARRPSSRRPVSSLFAVAEPRTSAAISS
jgi:hypothetical protein